MVAEGDDPAAVSDDLATGADALGAALANASVADDRVDTTEFRITEQRRSPDGTPGGPDATEAPAAARPTSSRATRRCGWTSG